MYTGNFSFCWGGGAWAYLSGLLRIGAVEDRQLTREALMGPVDIINILQVMALNHVSLSGIAGDGFRRFF